MKTRIKLIRACKKVLTILNTLSDSPHTSLGWRVIEMRKILNEALIIPEEEDFFHED